MCCIIYCCHTQLPEGLTRCVCVVLLGVICRMLHHWHTTSGCCLSSTLHHSPLPSFLCGTSTSFFPKTAIMYTHTHTSTPHHSTSHLQALLEWDLELNNEAAQEHTILSVTLAHSDRADEIVPLTHSACYHKSYWINTLLTSICLPTTAPTHTACIESPRGSVMYDSSIKISPLSSPPLPLPSPPFPSLCSPCQVPYPLLLTPPSPYWV